MRTFLLPAALFLITGFLVLHGIPDTPLHPCHQGGPGGPGGGPPCPPTPTPFSQSDGSQTQPEAGGAGQVGFLVRNASEENVTLWLGDPVRYVLNVPGKSALTFTVNRDVYSYDLAACGRITGGYLNLTIHSFIDIEQCENRTLVAVELRNLSGGDLAVQLHGPEDYVIPLRPGQTRPVTIARGEYEALLFGCPETLSYVFRAHAGLTIEYDCP